MRGCVIVPALLASSCSAPHHAAPTDLAPPVADLAFPPSDWGTFACPQSLAAYCANEACPTDVATAQATWCSSGWVVATGTCTGFTFVGRSGVDTGIYYIYDAMSGALVAVVGFNGNSLVPRQCVAGPVEIDLRACTAGTLLCPSMDGGA